MRQIDLNLVSEQNEALTGQAVLSAIVESPAGQGFTVKDIETAMRVKKDISEAIEGKVLLSETDWAWVKRQIETFRFSVVDQIFIDLNKNVLEAALVE